MKLWNNAIKSSNSIQLDWGSVHFLHFRRFFSQRGLEKGGTWKECPAISNSHFTTAASVSDPLDFAIHPKNWIKFTLGHPSSHLPSLREWFGHGIHSLRVFGPILTNKFLSLKTPSQMDSTISGLGWMVSWWGEVWSVLVRPNCFHLVMCLFTCKVWKAWGCQNIVRVSHQSSRKFNGQCVWRSLWNSWSGLVSSQWPNPRASH